MTILESLTSVTSDGAINTERPITVTVTVARKISGLGNTTLWKLIGNGTLATVRVGRRRLIDYESLRRLLTPGGDAGSTPVRRGRGRPRKSSPAVAP